MNDEFKNAVFTVIGAIPEGHVSSYGHVATLAGYPKNARAVGYLLKHLPKDSLLPWYRVLNSQRKISFPEGSYAYYRQLGKLQEEGVVFDRGRVRKEYYLG